MSRGARSRIADLLTGSPSMARRRGGGAGSDRRRRWARLAGRVALLAALALGGAWLAVTGGGPGRTPAARGLSSGLFFLAAGVAVALVLPRGRAWLWALAAAAAPLALGATGVVLAVGPADRGGLRLALLYLVGPAALAVAGAALGGALGRALRRRSGRGP